MENIQLAGIAAAALMPKLVPYVVDAKWIPVKDKRLIATATSLGLGIITTAVAGDITSWEDIITNIAIVLAAQHTAYEMWWKNRLIEDEWAE